MKYVDKNGDDREKDALFAPRFNGVIVFDECHKAKNYAVLKDNDDRTADKGSQTARYFIFRSYYRTHGDSCPL
jgi:hypothetical protein